MRSNPKDYINDLGITDCNECPEIQELQAAQNINIAPLFWQGEGRVEIPLVIMGINPSVVGTDNEPKRGCSFETYFNYYQFRKISEKENIKQALEEKISVPNKYWTMCHNLARNLIGAVTPRWRNYVLMEASHCFFNRTSDMGKEAFKRVSSRCFDRYTKNMLLFLKPRMILLLGNPPYELLGPHLVKKIDDYEFCSLQIANLRVPVMKHPHPSAFGPFYGTTDDYERFKQYCISF